MMSGVDMVCAAVIKRLMLPNVTSCMKFPNA